MLSLTINLYKNAFSGLTRRIWLLSAVMLVNRAGTMVLPFMTLYCTQKENYTYSQAGWAVGFYGLGSITGAFLGGRLSDKFGFYYIQVLALLSGGIMFLVVGQIHQYIPFCIAIFFLAMLNEAFRPANTSAISHYSTPKNRTQSFSLIRLAINFGWGIGGAFGGIIAGINYQLLFWVDGVTSICAGILLLIILPKVPLSQQLKSVKQKVKSATPYRDRPFMFYFVFMLLFATCFFQLFTTVPLFFKEELHLSEFWIGAIMSINGVIIGVFEMLIVYRLEGKKPYLLLITIGTFLMAVSFAVLNAGYYSPLLIPIIATLIITIAEMVAMPFMNTWYIARSTEQNRGQYAAIYTIAWSSAQVIGSTAGTQVAHAIGFINLWWLITAISIIAALGYFWLYKKERN